MSNQDITTTLQTQVKQHIFSNILTRNSTYTSFRKPSYAYVRRSAEIFLELPSCGLGFHIICNMWRESGIYALVGYFVCSNLLIKTLHQFFIMVIIVARSFAGGVMPVLVRSSPTIFDLTWRLFLIPHRRCQLFNMNLVCKICTHKFNGELFERRLLIDNEIAKSK